MLTLTGYRLTGSKLGLAVNIAMLMTLYPPFGSVFVLVLHCHARK